MITYCANALGTFYGHLTGKYEGLIGNLWGPGRGITVYPFAPYALDNGAWGAFLAGAEWSATDWLKLLAEVERKPFRPQWALVPDVVADREQTLASWEKWFPVVKAAGLTAAFAVQDGMTPADVPADAQVVFVGGSTEWKWRTVEGWCAAFPRVHVGRVNSLKKLLRCWEAGAESTDGTGWFRGRHRQLDDLVRFLDLVSGRAPYHRQGRLFGDEAAQGTVNTGQRCVGKIAYLRPPPMRRVIRAADAAVGPLFEQ